MAARTNLELTAAEADGLRHTCLMRTVIDLDVAVREIERRAEGWREAGFAVGPVTWRDQGEGWPASLKTERGAVADPDSIGVKVRRGDQEGSVVLFKGGWWDVEYWSGSTSSEPVMEAPGYPDGLTVQEFGRLLDSFTDRFR